MNESQAILNYSLANKFFSNTGALGVEANTISKTSSTTHKESKTPPRHTDLDLSESFVPKRLVSMTRMLHRSTNSFHTVSNPLIHG